jgi:hypothetical protein
MVTLNMTLHIFKEPLQQPYNQAPAPDIATGQESNYFKPILHPHTSSDVARA